MTLTLQSPTRLLAAGVTAGVLGLGLVPASAGAAPAARPASASTAGDVSTQAKCTKQQSAVQDAQRNEISKEQAEERARFNYDRARAAYDRNRSKVNRARLEAATERYRSAIRAHDAAERRLANAQRRLAECRRG